MAASALNIVAALLALVALKPLRKRALANESLARPYRGTK